MKISASFSMHNVCLSLSRKELLDIFCFTSAASQNISLFIMSINHKFIKLIFLI